MWKVPVAGGEETRVLGPAADFNFAVVADGIYYIEPPPLIDTEVGYTRTG